MADGKNTRTSLTRARVAEFACPPGQREAWLWDTATPGLALRAQGERVAWVWQRKLNGRAVRMTIGSREAWPLESVWSGKGAERREIQRGAREEARRLSGLLDSGIDPRNEKAALVEAAEAERLDRARAVVTLGEAWDAYVSERSAGWSESHRFGHAQVMTEPGKRRARGKKLTKPGVLHPLRSERLEALTAERLAAWLETESKTRPTVTASGFRLLRTFLNWAAERPEYRGLVDPAAVLTKDVRRRVPRQKPKDDCLQREQLPAWFAAVQAMSDPVRAAYLQGLLLTGARPGELAALRWDDVDFAWQALTLRDKAEGERTIPLPPYLAGLLHALPRRTRTDGTLNAWVFSSATTKHGRMGEPNHAHSRAVAAAGLPPLTLHGLRRSFGTLSEWVECPVGVVAQIQGHKPSAIAEKHYRRRPLDLLRVWHTRLEGWILTEAGILKPEPGPQAEGEAKPEPATQNRQKTQNPTVEPEPGTEPAAEAEGEPHAPRLRVVTGGKQ
jgi:integrase